MNNLTDSFGYEYEENGEEYDGAETHPLIWSIGLATLITYIVIFCFGIPANIYVLYRLRKLAKENREKYENGAGLGLFVMSTSDLFSLLAISLQHILPSVEISAPDVMKSLACKVLIFATHTMTSVSIWSWLLMSTVRYLAIRHPLLHLRIWRAPYRAIALIIFSSALTNVWLIFAVSSDRTGCAEQALTIGGMGDGSANRWLHLIECIWSYCVPVAAILYMDAMVFLYCPRRSTGGFSIRNRTGPELAQDTAIHRNNNKAHRGLWKWLFIALIDIMLNAPENLYRLIVLIRMTPVAPDLYYYSFRMIAQVLYFAQFAFNAVYLSLFVYDQSIRPDVPQSSAQNFALIETKLTSTQGYSSINQLREERYHSRTNILTQ
uniref:G-protein coupled receptors family 1 profile domain-containing protein n=1 Tax=Plectus sambesii TaxID=2011161 RepID=A0A914WZL8_9BILA